MTTFLIGVALSFVVQDTPQTSTQARKGQTSSQSIDGDWTVVYAEMDGKKQEGKGYTNVKIKNNMVTCSHDGKEKTWKLDFGPHHMVRSTEVEGNQDSKTQNTSDKSNHTHHGVYIAGQDFLCISCMKGRDQQSIATDGKSRQQTNQGQDIVQTGGQGTSGQGTSGQGSSGKSSTEGWQMQNPMGSEFVLILRRAGAADR